MDDQEHPQEKHSRRHRGQPIELDARRWTGPGGQKVADKTVASAFLKTCTRWKVIRMQPNPN